MIPCRYCQKPFSPAHEDHVFCTDKHRAAWHRENVPHGTVTRIAQLKNGSWSVSVKYDTLPPGLQIGAQAWCEMDASTRTDKPQGDEAA